MIPRRAALASASFVDMATGIDAAIDIFLASAGRKRRGESMELTLWDTALQSAANDARPDGFKPEIRETRQNEGPQCRPWALYVFGNSMLEYSNTCIGFPKPPVALRG